jgi:hypothetical protein
VHRGTGPVHRAGDLCQPGCVRLEDRRVHHRPRAGTRQAAVTQQPRDHTPTAPRSACGGRHTVAREVRGDRRTPHPTAASGVAPVAEARVRRERVRPRDRSHDTRRTAHPTRPVARDRAGFALARDRKGDMRKPQAHPRLPVSRGGRRRRPPGRHVWGSPPDRVTRLARQRGGGAPGATGPHRRAPGVPGVRPLPSAAPGLAPRGGLPAQQRHTAGPHALPQRGSARDAAATAPPVGRARSVGRVLPRD